MEVVVANESGEIEVGEVEGGGEEELDHHVVSPMGGGIEEDKLEGGSDKGTNKEEEIPRDHYVPSVGLINAHTPDVGWKAPELVVNARETTCVRCPVRQ
ncbi:hypothetical protein BHE74_00003824 [Ensete ventricosum]|nr:hypothetical protein BHE74_00003824 [Ensete ventricosum]